MEELNYPDENVREPDGRELVEEGIVSDSIECPGKVKENFARVTANVDIFAVFQVIGKYEREAAAKYIIDLVQGSLASVLEHQSIYAIVSGSYTRFQVLNG